MKSDDLNAKVSKKEIVRMIAYTVYQYKNPCCRTFAEELIQALTRI